MSALVDALCAAPPGDAALIYDTFNAASFLFDGAAAAALYDDGPGIAAAVVPPPAQQQLQASGEVAPPQGDEAQVATSSAPTARLRKRRRRARSCKSREETETQRMTHIAVERNRRRQMNEYLSVLRSLMPEPYVQRVRRRTRLSLPPFPLPIKRTSLRANHVPFFYVSSTCSSLVFVKGRERRRSDRGGRMFFCRKRPAAIAVEAPRTSSSCKAFPLSRSNAAIPFG
jgi:hypothetical protein